MNKKTAYGSIGLGLMVALTLSPHSSVLAEEIDEIVVSATGIPTPVSQIGSSVDVITAEDLEQQQITYLQDALTTVAGVSTYQSGGQGSTSNVFLRGMTGKYSGVYIDGVQINDPASQQAAWAHLPTHGLESIEVLRGSHGVLYGSEAIGGAINMFTAVGGENQNRIGLQTGSFGTHNITLSGRGEVNNLGYGLAIKQTESDGISAANENDGNSEEDGYESLSARGRFVFDVSENLSLDLALRSVSSEIETDNSVPSDVSGYYTDFDATGGRLSVIYDGETVQHNISHGRSEDISSSYTFSTLTTQGERNVTSYRAIKTYDDNMQLMVGVEQETESYATGNDKYEADNLAALAILKYHAGPFSGSMAVRRDDHDSFGKHDTFRVSGLIDGGRTATRFSYGTGFRAPSLYEMFGRSDYCVANICGNDALQPEESRGFDIGLIFKPSDRLSLEVARFDITVSDFITYGSEAPSDPNDPCLANNSTPDFTATSCGKYMQSNGDSQSQGYEMRFDYEITAATKVSGNFTKLDATRADGTRDIRRPEETLNLSLIGELSEGLSLSGSLQMVRDVVDDDFSNWPNTETADLDNYLLLDLAAAYKVTGNSELSLSIKNALDDDYETALGFGTPGRAFYVGVTSSF